MVFAVEAFANAVEVECSAADVLTVALAVESGAVPPKEVVAVVKVHSELAAGVQAEGDPFPAVDHCSQDCSKAYPTWPSEVVSRRLAAAEPAVSAVSGIRLLLDQTALDFDHAAGNASVVPSVPIQEHVATSRQDLIGPLAGANAP